MKRNKHSLSHYRLSTLGMGALYPVGMYEVLPGDTFQQGTSVLLRCSPLLAPVMHPVTVRIHHWFVPLRLLWAGWEDFITGGKDGLGDGVGTPPVFATPTPIAKGSLADHLGIPVGATGVSISQFPFLAYKKIWEDWYADQDFYDPATLPALDPYWDCLPVAWEKDYFTTSRPWPQKGPDVVVPLGSTAPVIPTGDGVPLWANDRGSTSRLQNNVNSDANWNPGNATSTAPAAWSDPKLVADLSVAGGANVNDFRRAFAIQRYQEARARYGSRYTEYLAYLGVRSSDARLQRSEFLGGGKQTISFSEVLKTGAGEDPAEPIGTMKGHGIAAMRSARYRRFFEEHGIVLSLLSVRPKTIYMDGIPRLWTRTTKEDYWQRELEQIGQQEVIAREVHHQGGNTVWGYQDRYSEYKQIPSTVHADFRDTLNHWHLARSFATPPALNGSFIICDPSKRIFAEQTTDPFWCMTFNSIQARRMVRRGSSSRII